MVQSDKNAAEAANPTAEEAAEIDRIMKEIEDLEKKMDSPEPELPEEIKPAELAAPVAQESKVVPLHVAPVAESLVESDAVPVADAPLMREPSPSSSAGSLALKIGGCAEISLEFTRASTTVYLSYSDDCLKITTDQGAEFRIPFKRAA